MEWQDSGIVLGTRKHGETSAIVEVMTEAHGRHLGLVRGGRSRRMQPMLQPGNSVHVTWRARLDEHLGTFQIEPDKLRAATLMETAASVYGVQAMASLLRLLPERDPHPHLHRSMAIILDAFDNPVDAGELYIRFEIAVLNDLGFGLDLSECAATGTREDLIYISPKSGRAVSAEAGAPWKDRMLSMPAFLRPESSVAADGEQLKSAFETMSYFLNRHVYEPRGLEPPTARDGFVQAVLKALGSTDIESHQLVADGEHDGG